MDDATKLWIRNSGDEQAAANGCRVDLLRGAYTVWWIERYCKLYEGEEYAGEPVILHGCHQCRDSIKDFWALPTWDEEGQQLAIERARLHAECVAAGHRVDWQYECFMRAFSWVRFDDRWRREVRRFKQISIWMAKKQKKSSTLAALGMYLLAGDGEPGQKVFLAAKDGDQARKNAAKHTVEMFYQSEELKSECTLNLSTLQLTHEPSRSVMYPLSSSNSRTQKSKEGLNGSVIVDETHVVDRAFVNRINRAGISRSEALFCEFSTAGNDPDSYGKERCDYVRDVLKGNKTDEELFGAIYEAPQDLTIEELDKDFDKYAAMANPSLGHTVQLREIRLDYERCKGMTLEALLEFLMYRLEIWQQSSNPWLRMSAWGSCASDFTEFDLLGKTCFGAFDLAQKWDTAAIVLLFPWGDFDPPHFRLWPYFFLPKVSAFKTKDKAHWFDWESKGHIKLTEGNVTDYPLIRQTIKDIARKFDLQALAYDERLAEYFSQRLQDEDGLPVTIFNQTPQNFAEPMRLFEEDVISQRIEHPNNLVMNWQAGNATLGRNGMLVKPELQDVKKIDGVVAAVMAREMAAAQPVATGPLFYH